ncbi:MAG: ABC transporter transmembrane domain-containing protein, partial [Defluviicoccus sp.]|nr:ABC transporter transmembrane domain-containing protein [Defluviicoccus sp.]
MSNARTGDREIRTALSESRRLFLSVGFFSVFVNLLMLTGPVFMLQVYDRVLTSRSEATLVTLVVITAFLFLMMGILDHARGRVLARAGARLQARLDARVLRAILARAIAPSERARPAMGLRDLEAMQRFASGTGPFAFFDAPWTPVFLCVLFLFHWMLGVLAVFSGCLLLLLALINQARTGRLQGELGEATARSAHFVERMRAGSETVRGLGMEEAVVARSSELRDRLLERAMAASDRSGFFGVATKTLRLFLQSMMLGLGAWLAIQGQVTFGAIIAASILLGRALAPIDQAVGQWPLLQQVLAARRSLARLLEETPPERPRTALPRPRALLEVQGIAVA